MFKAQNNNKKTKIGFRFQVLCFKNQESGMGLLEAIVAIGVFTIVMAAVVLMYINVTVGSLLALEKTKAIFLAQEGLEATRSIGFHNFYNLVSGVHGLGILENRWQLIGSSDLTDGRFARTITITSPDPVPYGLVGHWTFNDRRGCALRDISGEKNHGFLRPTCPANSPTWGLDRHNRVNRALSFDGVDDYVEMPHISGFSISKGTYELWFKPNELPFPAWDTLIHHETPTVNRNSINIKGVSGTSRLAFIVSNDAGVPLGGWAETSTSDLVAGNWYHVVGTWDSTIGEIRIYLNGVLQDTTIGTEFPFVMAPGIGIGKNLVHLGREANGIIDEVRIYNRALTAAEIRTLYNHGRQRIENRLEENIESRLIESRVEWNSPLLGAREVRLKKEITR